MTYCINAILIIASARSQTTVGGSQRGYERWEEFKRTRLTGYASRRNDPTKDGVSRMSAYLHYGMVSPMRLARDAHNAEAEKYLDELLIWRELAYCFVFTETTTIRLMRFQSGQGRVWLSMKAIRVIGYVRGKSKHAHDQVTSFGTRVSAVYSGMVNSTTTSE